MKKIYHSSAFKKWRNSFVLAITAGTASLVYLAGCSDLPTDVVLPVFTTGADVPLIDTTTTIDEIIKDTTFIKKDAKNGNLFITQEAAIPTTVIGDSLKLKETALSYSTSFNEQASLTKEAIQESKARVPINDIFPALPPAPNSSIIPPTPSGGVEKDIELQQPPDVEYIQFNKTNLRLGIGNGYPFDLTFGNPQGFNSPGVVIVFPDGSKEFLPLNETQRTIPKISGRGFPGDPGGFIETNLVNKEFKKGTRIIANISTTGSNGQPVNYDTNSVLIVRVFFNDADIKEAKFAYPAKQIVSDVISPLAGGAKITEGRISQLDMTLKLTNNFPVSGKLTISIPQFTRASDGAVLSKEVNIDRNSTQTVNITNGTDDYFMRPDTTDKNGYISAAHVQVSFAVDATQSNDKRTFKENDDLIVEGKISSLKFHSLKGLSLPEVKFNVHSESKFEVKGNISNLTFDELVLKQLIISMIINNGVGINGVLSGTADVMGKAGNKLATIVIADHNIIAADFSVPGSTIPKENIIDLNENGLNLKEIPYSIVFDGSVRTVENTPFSLNATDKIDGKIVITIPLALRIIGGEYKRELTALDIDADIRKREKNVESAELKIESRNRMPAAIGLSFQFFDADQKLILSIPTDAPTIAIPAAPVDANSIATAEAHAFQRVKLNHDQTKLLLGAKFYSVSAKFNTSGGSESFAKFRLEDYLKLKVGLDFKGNTSDVDGE
ncbi:MAG: hypothetical protein V4642_03770 [Bacteroidota bacterium]